MPGMRGLTGLCFLRAEFPSIPIAMISASTDPRLMRQAMDYGAAGFIPKSTPVADIRDAAGIIRANTAGLVDFTHQTRLIADLSRPMPCSGPIRHTTVERHASQTDINTIEFGTIGLCRAAPREDGRTNHRSLPERHRRGH